jgi:hypothetical protein
MLKNILTASYYLGLLTLVAAFVLRIAAAAGTFLLPVAPNHLLILAAAFFLCSLASRAVGESSAK